MRRARAYGQLSKADKSLPGRNIQSIEIPSRIGSRIQQGDGGYSLALVIDPALEKTAQRMIEAPESFFPDGEFKYQQYQDETFYRLRLAGMNLLRHFPSNRNQTLLRGRLDLPLLALEKNGFPQLRIKAYEVLIAWDVDLQIPSFASEITAIDLRNARPTETMLARLSKLKNLSLLRLDGGQVGDAEFRSLAQFNLLHLISSATQRSLESRPKSASDVFGLALHGFAITDASLNEILRFENLTRLNLRGHQGDRSWAGISCTSCKTEITRSDGLFDNGRCNLEADRNENVGVDLGRAHTALAIRRHQIKSWVA